MAEVFGIVTGVLGLLPLCRGELFSKYITRHTARTLAGSSKQIDGLAMIKDVFDAPKSLSLAVGRLELQKDVSQLLLSPAFLT